MIRKGLFALSFGLLLAGAVTADPLCSSFGSPQDVSGSFSCSLGGLTFSNFQVVSAAGNPAPAISLVSASTLNDDVILNFDPNISAPLGGGFQDIWFYFQVAGGVDQIDLTVGGVNATVTEHVCDTAFVANACTGNDLASLVSFSTPPGPSTATSSIFNITDPLFIFKDIDVSPNWPGSNGGGLRSFSQSFHVPGGGGGPGGGQIPEPSSLILTGSVVLGFCMLRRYKSAR